MLRPAPPVAHAPCGAALLLTAAMAAAVLLLLPGGALAEFDEHFQRADPTAEAFYLPHLWLTPGAEGTGRGASEGTLGKSAMTLDNNNHRTLETQVLTWDGSVPANLGFFYWFDPCSDSSEATLKVLISPNGQDWQVLWLIAGDKMPPKEWTHVRLPLPVNASSPNFAIRWAFDSYWSTCWVTIDDITFPAIVPGSAPAAPPGGSPGAALVSLTGTTSNTTRTTPTTLTAHNPGNGWAQAGSNSTSENTVRVNDAQTTTVNATIVNSAQGAAVAQAPALLVAAAAAVLLAAVIMS